MKSNVILFCFFFSIYVIIVPGSLYSQSLNIKGFVNVNTTIQNKKVSFGLGEQDLFLSSELTDKLSFLGETVFKYDASSATDFSVSVERVVIKYNIFGNNNVVIGKVHTPLNYWNDTYHHGRVFFPTIDRPLLFKSEIIPIHTTGMSFQGHDLGKLKFGYDVMVGNGIGSSDFGDNDSRKSWILAAHIKPADKLRFGISYYNDVIAKGAQLHDGRIMKKQVNQQLFSGSASHLGKKLEILAEGTIVKDRTDSTGSRETVASYFYGGYKITDKLIPYFRIDNIKYQNGELFYKKNNTTAYLFGIRYKINYLAVIKLEFMHQDFEIGGVSNSVTAQVAIGF